MRTVYANQHDTVDAIAWRHYGKTHGIVELIYQHNPGIADLGAVLPLGTAIRLPDIAPDDVKTVQTLINLWD